MKFIKCFIVLSLYLFIGACVSGYHLNIDIGEYEYHLDEWNSLNMLDYQLRVGYTENFEQYIVYINVKNGFPESSDPSSWLDEGKKSTIPEFFVYIKEEEERIKKAFNGIATCYMLVYYHPYLHYPWKIISDDSYNESYPKNRKDWDINLTPLEGYEQETGNDE